MRPRANAVLSAIPASGLVLVYREVERGRELTLEEVNRLVGDQIARQVLSRIHTTHNECTVAIGAFPQFDETGVLVGLLKLDRATHH